jgi:hypothetical protein
VTQKRPCLARAPTSTKTSTNKTNDKKAERGKR